MKLPFKTTYIIVIAVVATIGILLTYWALQVNEPQAVTELTGNIPDETNIPLENTFMSENSAETQTKSSTNWTVYVLVTIVALVFGPGTFFFFYAFVPLGLWWEARLSGIRIDWWKLVKMRWQRVPHAPIIKLLIKSHNSHVHIKIEDLTKLFLTGVDVEKIVETQILGSNAGLTLNSLELGSLSHAGVDVLKIVRNMITSHNAGIDIPMNELTDSFLAEVDIEEVVDTLIKAHNSGIHVNYRFLSQQFLANIDVPTLIKTLQIAQEGNVKVSKEKLVQNFLEGGKILEVVKSVVAANNADKELQEDAKLNLDYETAMNISLAGIDILTAVNEAINFKVLQTTEIIGYAGDGVEVRMKARVTVRPKIRKIIRGAGEETVLARVNEALVTEIGRVASHYEILEDPYEVADIVEKREELFFDTAFEVKSIDISDIKIGRSIHAELDIEIAKAESEKAKARVLSAEEEVQRAMAEAFRNGTFSIEDYKRMKNLESDTKMRESLTQQNILDNVTVAKKKTKNDNHDNHDNHDEHHH
jgi:uncharacterized protein YqfA (UPF0365 family)